MTRTKTNFVTQQQLKTMRGGRGLGHTHPNKDILDEITEDMLSKHPYISLERLQEYLYRVTFDRLPEDNGGDNPQPAACSAYVKDGKLYRNLDFNYDDAASFIVRTRDFEGMSFITGLNDGAMDDELIAQLPYRIVDGRNKYGIKVAVLVLFNDWDWTGTGERSISLTRLPYLILSRVKSMATISTDLAGVLDNLFASETLQATGYLLQVMVTDLTTTYAVIPPTREGRSYELMDITDCPKLTNFRPVGRDQVSRADSDIQDRPTGIERYNMMPCPLEDLRFTKAYESQDRLSEFIGIRDTTKDSTDAELLAIYRDARTEYLRRQRDGLTWQTMHSNVYGSRMEELYVQERWNLNCIGLEFAQLPDVFIGGTKAKPEESDEELKRITRLCFTAGTLTDEPIDLEVVTIGGKRMLHTSLPFFSDEEVTAGGVGSGSRPAGVQYLFQLLDVPDYRTLSNKVLKVDSEHSLIWADESAGTITGATIGGTAVPVSGGVLQFPAYPASGDNYDAVIMSLQSQVDSVAARDSFDELMISALWSDVITASSAYFGTLEVQGGIPKSALASGVQASLGKADSALQTHQAIYGLTIQKNGTAIDTYLPNSAAKTINISDVASAQTLAELKSWIESLFEKDTTSIPGTTLIKAKYGLYTNEELTAGGVGSGSRPAGVQYLFQLLDVPDYRTLSNKVLKVDSEHSLIWADESAGTITGATIGGTAVPVSGGVLQFPAYPASGDNYDAVIMSLQSQVDSVAARDSFDELMISALWSDVITASSAYFGTLEVQGGIPKSALASGVQTSLGKADSALQTHQAIYGLTIQKNGTAIDTYLPNSAAKTINISDVASAQTLAELKSWIESLFEKDTTSIPGTTLIKAKYGLYTNEELTAGGVSSGSRPAGVQYLFQLLDVPDYRTLSNKVLKVDSAHSLIWADESAGTITGATIGGTAVPVSGGVLQFPAYPTSGDNYDAVIMSLQSQVDSVAARDSFDELMISALWSDVITASSAYFGTLEVQGGIPKSALASGVQASLGKADSALQTHQAIYGLTIQKNGTAIDTYLPNSAAKTINISDVASAQTLAELISRVDSMSEKDSAAIISLQSQIDSVANRDSFDELTVSAMFADCLAATNIYGALHGNADTATSAGNADTVDGEHSSAFAHIGAHNNLTASGNEFTFASSGFSGAIYLNYRTAGGSNGNITDYIFSNGAGGTLTNLSTLITSASEGHTAYNDLTTISQAIISLQSQIDSVASRDFSELAETLMSLKMWIEDMFEKTPTGIRAKYNIYTAHEVTAGA